MKATYLYPELFLNKVGGLYWSLGHPPSKVIQEDNWAPLYKRANRLVPVEELSENEPKLTVISEYGNIDYIRTGQKGAPRLLLVPGFPDCWYTFHKIIPILAKHYDVISFSPPGHGYSTFTSSFDFRIDSYTRVVRMMIQKLQLAPLYIVGHSCGGEISLRTMLQTKSKDLIRALILINSWAPSVIPKKTNWDFSEDVSTWPIVGKELVRIFGGRLGGLQEMFKKIFYRPEDRKHLQNLEEELSKPFLNGTAFQLFINNQTAHAISEMQREQKRINENVQQYFLDTREQYGYLPEIPTLVVGTSFDRIFPLSYARSVFRAIQKHNPRTYFRKIKPSGHMPAIEAPDRLAYQMLNFLQKVEHPELLSEFPQTGENATESTEDTDE